MEISVPYVNTHDNLADFFTKPQDKNTFIAMRDIIMNVSIADSQSSSVACVSDHEGALKPAGPVPCSRPDN